MVVLQKNGILLSDEKEHPPDAHTAWVNLRHYAECKPDTEDYTLYDSFSILNSKISKTSLWWKNLEYWLLKGPEIGRWSGKGHEGTLWVDGMFCIL